MRKSVVSREPTKNVRYLTATSTTKDDTSESKLYSERTGQCKHLQDDLSNKSSFGMDQDPPCYPSTSKELVLRKNTVFIHKYQYNIYIYCIVKDFDRQHLRWFLNLASGCRLHLQPGTPRLLVGKTPSGAKRSHVKWWFGQVNCWRNHELEGQIYWVKCSKHIDET